MLDNTPHMLFPANKKENKMRHLKLMQQELAEAKAQWEGMSRPNGLLEYLIDEVEEQVHLYRAEIDEPNLLDIGFKYEEHAFSSVLVFELPDPNLKLRYYQGKMRLCHSYACADITLEDTTTIGQVEDLIGAFSPQGKE